MSNPAKKVQLNIRMPAELRRRVAIVAEARDESVDYFVSKLLDERTKAHKKDVDSIVLREQKRL
jgi:predicted HicB family RNase H-like nuclease